jgi:hypothetical protein
MECKKMKTYKQQKAGKSKLELLTAATLILPGLLQTPAHATDDDEVDFQYSHYQEGKRDIYIDSALTTYNTGTLPTNIKAPNPLNPIEVESLHGGAKISLSDRVKFGFNYIQDTWGGATPIATAPVVYGGMTGQERPPYFSLIGASPFIRAHNDVYLDPKGNFHERIPGVFDFGTGSSSPDTPGAINNKLTHTLVSASPEVRQQGDFKLGYDWDEASITIGGGTSVERDYDSHFGNIGTRLDFNQKRTSVNWGLSYTNSDTHAILDPNSVEWVTKPGSYNLDLSQQYFSQHPQEFNSFYSTDTQGTITVDNVQFGTNYWGFKKATLTGNRQDWGTNLGLTQVLTKNSLLELGAGYTHSAGYLSNPYKAVYVFSITPNSQDPNQAIPLSDGGAQWEARPHERNQMTANLGYNYYLEPLDAGLHGRYSVFHDDWGITSHTFDADWVQPLGAGWSLTPNVRYYSQSAADFYAPYLTTVQVLDPNGNPINSSLNRTIPKYYASDQRLSGFGALSGGVTVATQFAKGIKLEAGFEYYTHQGSLKLGSGGEQDFANYDYWTANAALKVNLGALRFGGGSSDTANTPHHHDKHNLAPAGIMFNHALANAGDMMVGYRYMRNEQAGDMLHGSNSANLDQVHLQGCGNNIDILGNPLYCAMAPTQTVMNMHMLDLMFAPTDWLTLMLMPQWMDMTMDMGEATPMLRSMGMGNGEQGEGVTSHQTGGIGDTGMYALFKLFDRSGHQVVLSVGGTAPTGSIDNNVRINAPDGNGITPGETPLDYGMQLGSGTWDLKPSFTYSGAQNAFSWGAQATGTKRLDNRNSQHYALGDIFQGSAWGGYQWTNWLSTTVRSVYTWQGQIRGGYPDFVFHDGTFISYMERLGHHEGPNSLTSNYGGQYVDLGLGLSVTVPGGTFAGNTIKFEWLQPVHTDYNGYQLDRSAALTATWGIGF